MVPLLLAVAGANPQPSDAPVVWSTSVSIQGDDYQERIRRVGKHPKVKTVGKKPRVYLLGEEPEHVAIHPWYYPRKKRIVQVYIESFASEEDERRLPLLTEHDRMSGDLIGEIVDPEYHSPKLGYYMREHIVLANVRITAEPKKDK